MSLVYIYSEISFNVSRGSEDQGVLHCQYIRCDMAQKLLKLNNIRSTLTNITTVHYGVLVLT